MSSLAPEGRNFTVQILPVEDPKDFSYPRLQQGGKKVMFFQNSFFHPGGKSRFRRFWEISPE